jgi:hypothetical protein
MLLYFIFYIFVVLLEERNYWHAAISIVIYYVLLFNTLFDCHLRYLMSVLYNVANYWVVLYISNKFIFASLLYNIFLCLWVFSFETILSWLYTNLTIILHFKITNITSKKLSHNLKNYLHFGIKTINIRKRMHMNKISMVRHHN